MSLKNLEYTHFPALKYQVSMKHPRSTDTALIWVGQKVIAPSHPQRSAFGRVFLTHSCKDSWPKRMKLLLHPLSLQTLTLLQDKHPGYYVLIPWEIKAEGAKRPIIVRLYRLSVCGQTGNQWHILMNISPSIITVSLYLFSIRKLRRKMKFVYLLQSGNTLLSTERF